jgi:hypothetical protein
MDWTALRQMMLFSINISVDKATALVNAEMAAVKLAIARKMVSDNALSANELTAARKDLGLGDLPSLTQTNTNTNN